MVGVLVLVGVTLGVLVRVNVGVIVGVLVGVDVFVGELVGVTVETPHKVRLKLITSVVGLQPLGEVRVKLTRSVCLAVVDEVNVKPPEPLGVIEPPPPPAFTVTVSPA